MYKRNASGNYTEEAVQCQLVAWLRADPRKILFTATVGGVRCGPIQGKRIKAQGYNPGVPDLLFFEPREEYHGLAVELKAIGGKASPLQLEWISLLKKRGYKAVVCVGLDEAKEMINDYMTVQPSSSR